MTHGLKPMAETSNKICSKVEEGVEIVTGIEAAAGIEVVIGMEVVLVPGSHARKESWAIEFPRRGNNF